MRRHRAARLALCAAAGLLSCGEEAPRVVEPPEPVPFTARAVVTGLDRPVLVGAPQQHEGLWIATKPGIIHVLPPDGPLTVFLDISNQVKPVNNGGFHGLASFAFHPQYGSNGYFYVVYTHSNLALRLSRFEVRPDDPWVADAASERVILSLPREFGSIHDGCHIAFEPSTGYLFMSVGDGTAGGLGGSERARDLATPWGKMLRIDVDRPDPVSLRPYSIPPGNPFVGVAGALPEIWSRGWRNPWRFSFDASTGDLIVADAGQSDWEEVNWEPAGAGGRDYGWSLLEAGHCTPRLPVSCDPDSVAAANGLTRPVFEYEHASGDVAFCAVIGGYVYRGTAIPNLNGRYFFADYCNETAVWSFEYVGGQVHNLEPMSDVLGIPHGFATTSFGLDGFNELYFMDWWAGRIFKIVPIDG